MSYTVEINKEQARMIAKALRNMREPKVVSFDDRWYGAGDPHGLAALFDELQFLEQGPTIHGFCL